MYCALLRRSMSRSPQLVRGFPRLNRVYFQRRTLSTQKHQAGRPATSSVQRVCTTILGEQKPSDTDTVLTRITMCTTGLGFVVGLGTVGVLAREGTLDPLLVGLTVPVVTFLGMLWPILLACVLCWLFGFILIKFFKK